MIAGATGYAAKRENVVAGIALAAFVLFAGIGVANHEMWRDEHHAWLIARDAATPLDVIRNLRWDMNPALFHLSLWPVTRVTHDPRAMQWLNLAFATLAAWLLLRHAPLRPALRLLAVFGYYLAYEYAVISRVYALGALFIFALCTLWTRRAERPSAIGILLALLANTSLYGVIAAGFFLILLAVDIRARSERVKAFLGSAALGVAGVAISLLQSLPRGDNPFAMGKATLAFDPERLATAVRLLASTFVPIPDAGHADWWNSNIVTGRSTIGDATLALAGVALVAWLLRHAPAIFAAWLAATGAIMLVAYQGGFASMRHGGYLIVLLIAAFWIAGSANETIFDDGRRRLALLLVFAIGAAGAATAWLEELATPFSAVEQTAGWLRDNGLDHVPIAGADDFAVASLASLLDLDRIYYPQRGEWGTFVSWDPKRRRDTTLGEATADVASRVAASGEPMLFVLTRPPTRSGPQGAVVIRDAMIAPGVRARLLAAFTDSVVDDEKMFVYEVAPVAPRPR
ncbi:MAG: hypothetical protein WC538_14480 [Thermoanaerobaculia bacterium]|jgi:hypothetical protein